MAESLLSNWHPELSYDFELRIGKSDYSTDLNLVQIRSGINVPYQHIFLDLFIDPRDILAEQLFGQEPIKLIIHLRGKEPSGYADDIKFNFDLMYINIESNFSPTQHNYDQDQWERTIIRLKTIPIAAYKTMSSIVNKIYFNKTPDKIITDLIDKIGNGTRIDYDSQGKSTLNIDQMIIPPTTLYNVIKYMNRTYGIFNGPLGLHCTFENKLKIQNLNKRVRNAQKFSLYLISTNDTQKGVFDAEDPSMFYTKTSLSSAYEANSVFAVEAPSKLYIVKPKNKLSKIINIDLDSFTKDFGIIEKNNPKIYYNKKAINPDYRMVVQKDQTGYDSDQTFINSTLSFAIREMAVTSAQIDGNLPIMNLMEVGEHIKIISKVDEHLKLGGAYILKASEIKFMKGQEWEASATINMIRSNIAAQ